MSSRPPILSEGISPRLTAEYAVVIPIPSILAASSTDKVWISIVFTVSLLFLLTNDSISLIMSVVNTGNRQSGQYIRKLCRFADICRVQEKAMPQSHASFIQKVSTFGYHWADTRHPKSGKLIPAILEGRHIEMPTHGTSIEDHLAALDDLWQSIDPDAPSYTEYSSEDHPELYRRFANLPLVSEAVLEFVSTFGFLGVGHSITIIEDENPDGTKWGEYQTAEFANDWVRQIRMMQSSVNILDALDDILKPDTDALHKWFIYKESDWRVKAECLPGYKNQGKVEWVNLDCWTDDPNEFGSIPADDIIQVSTEFLRVLVTHQLEGRTSAMMIWDKNHTQTQLVHRPISLLGAMWVQFAGVLTRTNRFRSCAECGKVFELVRRDKAFCSEACQKRYGRKKAKRIQNT